MAPRAVTVATVCTGNICRSPMAEVLLRHYVSADPRLKGRVEVASAGTARWHVGRPMDPRARGALDRAGLVGSGTVGAYADRSFIARHDLILVMTREHRREIYERSGSAAVDVRLWRNLVEPGCELDLADPYYGDDSDFDDCLDVLAQGAPALLEDLIERVLFVRRGGKSLPTQTP